MYLFVALDKGPMAGVQQPALPKEPPLEPPLPRTQRKLTTCNAACECFSCPDGTRLGDIDVDGEDELKLKA